MRRLAPWALLFAAALVFGVMAGAGPAADSPLASVHNPGPAGAQVLKTWLSETGASVEAHSQPLTALPPGIEVLVIAAPVAREVTKEEVGALERFVREGGTLFYLSPRPAKAQPALARWLELEDSVLPLAEVKDAALGDLGGSTVSASLPGVRQLRVSADTALEAAEAAAIAGGALWRRTLGQGEVWIAAGPDLIENRRLDLLDNAQLWARLRAKRIAFDEFHFGAAASPQWSANLWASFGQFLFVALLFVAARAPRLGPARPALSRTHRSSQEYLSSMGAVMRRAGVEGELKQKLRERLRRLMQERLGIAVTLSAGEASRALAAHTGLAAEAWLALDARLTGEGGFTAAAADAARIEDVVVGRRG